MKLKTPVLAALFACGSAINSEAVNVLINPSFEEPALGNVRLNNLGSVPTGWSQTGAAATWNMIRLDGAPYASGPDNAADGLQIIDINGAFDLFQSFTITSASNISFGASFSNREANTDNSPSTVGIYDAAGTTLLSSLASVNLFGTPTPSTSWSVAQETITNLAPGTYQVRIDLNNFNNVDGVFVDVTAIPEPSSFGLLALAGLGLIGRRRR